MKLWMKLAGTGVLAVAAVWSAAAAIGGITGPADAAAEPEAGTIVWPGSVDDAEFILREYDGCVAVFAAGESSPMTMTDIQVKSLREADRALRNAGLPCETRDEVLTLLEDLGS